MNYRPSNGMAKQISTISEMGMGKKRSMNPFGKTASLATAANWRSTEVFVRQKDGEEEANLFAWLAPDDFTRLSSKAGAKELEAWMSDYRDSNDSLETLGVSR